LSWPGLRIISIQNFEIWILRLPSWPETILNLVIITYDSIIKGPVKKSHQPIIKIQSLIKVKGVVQQAFRLNLMPDLLPFQAKREENLRQGKAFLAPFLPESYPVVLHFL
jgi:hypothetical protein